MPETSSRRQAAAARRQAAAEARAAEARDAADRAAAEEAAREAAARRPASPGRERSRSRSPGRRSSRQRSRSRSPALTKEQIMAAIAEGMKQKEKGLNVGSAPKREELKLAHRLIEHVEKASREDQGEWLYISLYLVIDN